VFIAAHPSTGRDRALPNGLDLGWPAEAGNSPSIVAPAGGPCALPYSPARRVSFGELLGVVLG